MQIMVFLPMILFMLVFGVLIAGFLLLVFKIMIKTKNSYWKGKIVDKLYNTKREDDKVSEYYTLVVETNDGPTRKVAVSKQMYATCNVGDTLEKPKGKLNPIKIARPVYSQLFSVLN